MNRSTLALFDQFADAEQSDLAAIFSTRHVTIQNCGDVLRNTLAEVRARGWKNHDAIWNPCLFLNTVTYDHSIYVMQLAYERDDWRRSLIARNLATLMFEIAEDLPTVFGQDFNRSLKELNVPPELISGFRMQLKCVSGFWESNRELLKLIRTVCGAHREHDALLLHQTIDEIDEFKLLRLGVELGQVLNSIGKCAQVIIDFTSKVQPPELR